MRPRDQHGNAFGEHPNLPPGWDKDICHETQPTRMTPRPPFSQSCYERGVKPPFMCPACHRKVAREEAEA